MRCDRRGGAVASSSLCIRRTSGWNRGTTGEKTGAISDEQGGSRQAKGMPDQIFLLREIISDRPLRLSSAVALTVSPSPTSPVSLNSQRGEGLVSLLKHCMGCRGHRQSPVQGQNRSARNIVKYRSFVTIKDVLNLLSYMVKRWDSKVRWVLCGFIR